MPSKLPTATKKHRGTYAPSRGNPHEPVGTVVCPKAPAHLDDIASEFFNRHSSLLADMRVMTASDIEMLEMAATSYSMWRAGLKMIEQSGGIGEYLIDASTTQQIPLVNSTFRAQELYLKHSQRLGLDPVSRSSVIAQDTGEADDPVAGMLKVVK